MRLLRTERKLTRLQAILWGWKRRKSTSTHLAQASVGVLSILAMDTLRTLVRSSLRIVTYPLVVLARLLAQVSKLKNKQNSRETAPASTTR